MGYTTAVEPAMPPVNALATQLELAEIPLLDRGGLCVMGNDDQLLQLLRDRESADAVRDLVALNVATSRALGVKVINAGGADAFKDGAVRFSLDDEVPAYGLTSRTILNGLLDAVEALKVPHPLHVHCSNLGLPGADDSLIETLEAAEGRRIHFAHAQFYAYAAIDKDNPLTGGFQSAAPRIAEALARHPNATLDIGQVVFGQTATISLDILRQFSGRKAASPKKWIVNAGDAEGGGIVPFRYRDRGPTSSLQFAIGLEMMLLSPDPERTILTTDHPNGGPFTAYPRILHLLMDKEARDREVAAHPKVAAERSGLAAIEREYTLTEVAQLTRSGRRSSWASPIAATCAPGAGRHRGLPRPARPDRDVRPRPPGAEGRRGDRRGRRGRVLDARPYAEPVRRGRCRHGAADRFLSPGPLRRRSVHLHGAGRGLPRS